MHSEHSFRGDKLVLELRYRVFKILCQTAVSGPEFWGPVTRIPMRGELLVFWIPSTNLQCQCTIDYFCMQNCIWIYII